MTAKREARHTVRLPRDVSEWLEAQKLRLGLSKNTIIITTLREAAEQEKGSEQSA